MKGMWVYGVFYLAKRLRFVLNKKIRIGVRKIKFVEILTVVMYIFFIDCHAHEAALEWFLLPIDHYLN